MVLVLSSRQHMCMTPAMCSSYRDQHDRVSPYLLKRLSSISYSMAAVYQEPPAPCKVPTVEFTHARTTMHDIWRSLVNLLLITCAVSRQLRTSVAISARRWVFLPLMCFFAIWCVHVVTCPPTSANVDIDFGAGRKRRSFAIKSVRRK